MPVSDKTRKIHDGIAGAVIVAGVLLGFNVAPAWFWLSGVIGIAMVISAFTGFCPVYFILGKCGMK